jgi:hypothetical protein
LLHCNKKDEACSIDATRSRQEADRVPLSD